MDAKSPLLVPPQPTFGQSYTPSLPSNRKLEKSSLVNDDKSVAKPVKDAGTIEDDIKLENSVSSANESMMDVRTLNNPAIYKSGGEAGPSKFKTSQNTERSNHIQLKYTDDELKNVTGSATDYKASSEEDNEDYDDEYDDEGEEEEEESLDELLFLEAVASLNENISMLTINSTEIFNSFQTLVKETNMLSGTLQEFSKNLKSATDDQQNKITQMLGE